MYMSSHDHYLIKYYVQSCIDHHDTYSMSWVRVDTAFYINTCSQLLSNRFYWYTGTDL